MAATSNSTVLLCKKRKVYVQNIDPPTRSIDSTASEVGTCGLRHINTVQLAVRDEDGKTLVTLGNGDGEIQVIEVA